MISAIIDVVSKVVDRAIPDTTKKAEITADLTKALYENQSELVKAASEVMKADASSESALTRLARPMTVYWSLFIITWIILFAPALGVTQVTLDALKQVPDLLWMLLTVGIGAYPVASMFQKKA